MKKNFITLFYILFLFNTNLFGDQNNKSLKVGLIAPLSGPYSEIGNSLLYSLQLALEEINDKNVTIIPRDSGYNDDEKLNSAISEIRSLGVKVVIGPTTFREFKQVKKYNDLIFISPSNISPELSKNIISIGVSLESQLTALTKFIKNQKKTKTIIMYPKNEYAALIEQKLGSLDLENKKVLDMGCGTGILAIFAEMKGAQPTDAIDIDSWCYQNSIENVQRNGCKHITVLEGDSSLLKGKKYDVIIANINRNILLSDMKIYTDCLHQEGILLLSGFYKADIAIIESEVVKHGLVFDKMIQRNSWVALKYLK